MKIINKSRKVIAVNGEAFLPGKEMEISEQLENHPSIRRYLADGIIADAASVEKSTADAIADAERARIAEEAVAKYKAEQEAAALRKAKVEAVKTMKKADLVKEAISLGIEGSDSEGIDSLREKVLMAYDA